MKPFFLFAPGAGAPSLHPWMQRWREHLETIGRVVAFDYSYMREHRKRPDPLPMLVAAHRQALVDARPASGAPTILIGKSMGGRVGCHLALEEKVDALVCLGYPLCGGGDQAKLRDKVLLASRTPILFVQGTRDPLCPLDALERVRSEMQTATALHIVADGDHSLLVAKRQLRAAGETQEQVEKKILEAIAEFVDLSTQVRGRG